MRPPKQAIPVESTEDELLASDNETLSKVSPEEESPDKKSQTSDTGQPEKDVVDSSDKEKQVNAETSELPVEASEPAIEVSLKVSKLPPQEESPISQARVDDAAPAFLEQIPHAPPTSPIPPAPPLPSQLSPTPAAPPAPPAPPVPPKPSFHIPQAPKPPGGIAVLPMLPGSPVKSPTPAWKTPTVNEAHKPGAVRTPEVIQNFRQPGEFTGKLAPVENQPKAGGARPFGVHYGI